MLQYQKKFSVENQTRPNKSYWARFLFFLLWKGNWVSKYTRTVSLVVSG